MLVGARNACPCARAGDDCRCDDTDRARYRRRLSGPLLDRIDLICELGAAPALELVSDTGAAREASATVRERVVAARERQRVRLAGSRALCNADMDARLTRRHVRLGSELRSRMVECHQAMSLTARGHDRVLRLARTIADLDGRDRVGVRDIEEAVGYRLAPEGRAAA